MNAEEALAAQLRAVGAAVAVEPPDGLAASVLARLGPAPRRRRTARPALALAVAVLLGLLAAPPVRAAVAQWFRLAGAVVHVVPGPGPTQAPAPPRATGSSLAQTRGLAFRVLTLPGLGAPDGVEVPPGGRAVSQSWDRPDLGRGGTGGAAGRVRLDQFDGRLDYAFVKTAPEADWLTVGGRTALWFERPSRLQLLDADGSVRATRVAGHTLVWETADSVLRLEGDLTQPEAVALAGTARVRPAVP